MFRTWGCNTMLLWRRTRPYRFGPDHGRTLSGMDDEGIPLVLDSRRLLRDPDLDQHGRAARSGDGDIMMMWDVNWASGKGGRVGVMIHAFGYT